MEQKLKVEYLPIEELTPYANNAKLHPMSQIEEIKNSILAFGMNDPIAICGNDNVVVEGNGRLTACKQLGYKEVPVVRLDHLTEEQQRAYNLVHNKLTMNTGFDLELLEQELSSIEMNMLQFGFEDIPEMPGINIEPEENPEEKEKEVVVKVVFRNADVWQEAESTVKEFFDGVEGILGIDYPKN